MAKLNAKYELMAVYSLAKGEEVAKELVEKFKSKIEAAATLDEVNEWGKRKLAYPINDEPDGYYALYSFTATPDFPAELERVLNITDGVLRPCVEFELPLTDHIRQSPPENDRLILSMLFAGGSRRNL